MYNKKHHNQQFTSNIMITVPVMTDSVGVTVPQVAHGCVIPQPRTHPAPATGSSSSCHPFKP
jgi:hypothetical protein